MLKRILTSFLCLASLASLGAETTDKADIKVLAFAGSAREDSINKILILQAADLARRQGVDVTVIDLKDYPMPIYDADLELDQGMPQKAREFRKLMVQSNIIMIASPEYNGSVSALLKNTLDWASRGENGGGSREAFKDKKFIIMSASPGGGGGAKGLVHLRSILEHIGGKVMPKQVSIPHAGNAFDQNGQLKDKQKQREIYQAIESAI